MFPFGDEHSGAEAFMESAPEVPARSSTVDAPQVPDATDVVNAVPWTWTTDKILYAVAGVAAVAVGVYFIADFVRAKNASAHSHETPPASGS